jgi:hypothetical protein
VGWTVLQVLKVKHVLVCGHTNCGAVKAALTLPASSTLLSNCWINQIRDIRNRHVDELVKLSPSDQVARLVELNVVQQVFNVCTSPVVQQMWEHKCEVNVHGLLYSVHDGSLKRLVGPISGNEQVPEQDAEKFEADLDGRSLADALKRFQGACGNAEAKNEMIRQFASLNPKTVSDALGSSVKRLSYDGEEGETLTEDGILKRIRRSLDGFSSSGAQDSSASNDAALKAMLFRLVDRDDMDTRVHEQMRTFSTFERKTSHC